jgi:hypothetical protein
LSSRIDEYRHSTRRGSSVDARDKGFCLCFYRADSNSGGVGSDTSVANIDIIMTRGEIAASLKA